MKWTSMTASGSYSWIYFNKSKCIRVDELYYGKRQQPRERWESMEASIRGKVREGRKNSSSQPH